MKDQRLRRTRRTQAAVIGIGVAGALGAAAAIGGPSVMSSVTSSVAGTTDTHRQHSQQVAGGRHRISGERDDDEGGRAQRTQPKPAPVAVQPAASGSHATTSGS